YEVKHEKGSITFLDTPGHEAFTAMRARGAMITDVVVLVIAADSSVMPQTVEAIDHARAANVQIIVVINKMDLPTANSEKIKKQLSQHNILVEEWGGKTICVEISCKTGQGIDKLLELLVLEMELRELKANPNCQAHGVIVEAKLDRGKGPIATVLIQKGTLHTGDCFITGTEWGRVRLMLDERGKSRGPAGPSVPVQVLGLDGIPQAGDAFVVVKDEKTAREKSSRRRQAKKERESRQLSHVTLDTLHSHIDKNKIEALNLIVKGDVDGSVEALCGSLQQLSTAEVKINIVHKSVGSIKESDVLLASTSNAIIIGFHIRPNSKIKELAYREKVDLRIYKIIYEAVKEIKKALSGKLKPEEREDITATVEIRRTFKVSKVGTIAGCKVTNGTIKRTDRVRVIRDSVEVAETTISSLRREKEDVREVPEGFECGLKLENFNDIKEGDVVEAFNITKIQREL
ncbi:MAG: translation initiation factor IF-2, partial [bacterium]